MSAEQAGGAPGSGATSDRMRALLSRAAEEQLSEQRQVSAVLADLRTVLDDVDERLATGEQVERVAAEVRASSARVEARLDAVEARYDELAARLSDATAMVGQAAQDLVEAVAAGVAVRLESLLEASERRSGEHVDDAVIALAEVVLRRRHAATSVTPAPQEVRQAPAADAAPGDGFVLVPADVAGDDGPAPAPQEERRTADRRGEPRGDGSGRRRRPWWRPA